MVLNGYRVGPNPEKWTYDMFATRTIIFIVGLIISNVHIALLYCDSEVKQVQFKLGQGILSKKKSTKVNILTKFKIHRVILINQSISVSSQIQFFEIVSSKSVVKSSFGKYFKIKYSK